MVVAHDLGRAGHGGGSGDLGAPARPVFGQEGGAAQGILAVGRHQLDPARSALVRIPHPALEFPQQPPLARFRLAGGIGGGVAMHLDKAVAGANGDETQPQPAAERDMPRQRLATAKGGHGEVDPVGHRLPCDALLDKGEVHVALHLDDDGIGVLVAHGHDIGPGDFRFHLVALPFEEGLDGRVEIGFACGGHGGILRYSRPFGKAPARIGAGSARGCDAIAAGRVCRSGPRALLAG